MNNKNTKTSQTKTYPTMYEDEQNSRRISRLLPLAGIVAAACLIPLVAHWGTDLPEPAQYMTTPQVPTVQELVKAVCGAEDEAALNRTLPLNHLTMETMGNVAIGTKITVACSR